MLQQQLQLESYEHHGCLYLGGESLQLADTDLTVPVIPCGGILLFERFVESEVLTVFPDTWYLSQLFSVAAKDIKASIFASVTTFSRYSINIRIILSLKHHNVN